LLRRVYGGFERFPKPPRKYDPLVFFQAALARTIARSVRNSGPEIPDGLYGVFLQISLSRNDSTTLIKAITPNIYGTDV